MNRIIDTHAHLYYPELLSELKDILNRAKDNGIEKIIIPAVNLETSLHILKLTEEHEMLYCAIGIHPGDVKESSFKDIDEIEKLISHEKVVAIGETGLDYYWDKSFIEKQKEFFKLQIEIAKDKNLPIVIHTRDSTEDAINIVRENRNGRLKGQFHCFSGSIEQLKEITELKNFYVSFCGNVTYKKNSGDDIVKACPEGKLLSETDSPFLPPVPYRGKKNEPSYIVKTLEKISEIRNDDYDKLLEKIFYNSLELFFPKSI
ncbi:MAG: putative metal-dependent hydrolase YcfH [Ignavibacteria bacterium]|nr:putative metal-dependent hydrolase YcfH [Ignavibacteria bacterium]